jgi:SAM-dependent methyltransferase
MLNVSIVENAFRLILGREANDGDNLSYLAESLPDVQALRVYLFSSLEFQNQLVQITRAPSFAVISRSKAMKVQVKTSTKNLIFLKKRIANQWTYLGTHNPYWSVLTSEGFTNSNFKKNAGLFYNSGLEDSNAMLLALERNGIEIKNIKTVLDYGCGVGRVTSFLAKNFREVVAVDISLPLLKIAKKYVREQGIRNVKFKKNSKPEDFRALPMVDCLYCRLVLFHNPPPLIYKELEAILRKVKRGGVAYFQLGTFHTNYRFATDLYLKTPASNGLEIHFLPMIYVFELLARLRFQVLEVVEDGALSIIPNAVSNTFLVYRI